MIYFCIPAYNEAATVGLLLWKIRRVMEEFPRDYEILVLDDASTDETLDVLAPYARVLPLTVIQCDDRGGYARALERLIREAVRKATHPKRDVVVTLQADYTEAPEDIPQLIKKIEGGADIVEGAILSEGDSVPRMARLARRGMPFFLRGIGLPEEIVDPASSFRAYRVSVLKRMLADRNGDPLLSSDGWAANVELIAAAATHSRRTENFEISRRHQLRQRPSRFEPWETVKRLWNVGRQLRRSPISRSPEATAD